MSPVTYKLLHVLGLFLLFGSLGGLWALSASGQGRSVARRVLLISHGVGLLLVLIAGFGMLAKLGMMGGWPPWVWVKIVIWILVAVLPMVQSRFEKAPGYLFFLAPILGFVAAYAVLFRLGAG